MKISEWLIGLLIRIVRVRNGTKVESLGDVRIQLPSFVKVPIQGEIGAWNPRLNTRKLMMPGPYLLEQLHSSLVQLLALISHCRRPTTEYYVQVEID